MGKQNSSSSTVDVCMHNCRPGCLADLCIAVAVSPVQTPVPPNECMYVCMYVFINVCVNVCMYDELPMYLNLLELIATFREFFVVEGKFQSPNFVYVCMYAVIVSKIAIECMYVCMYYITNSNVASLGVRKCKCMYVCMYVHMCIVTLT